MVLDQRHIIAASGRGCDFAARIAAGEGQEGINFDIIGKDKDIVRIDQRAVRLEGKTSLPGIFQVLDEVQAVAGQETCKVKGDLAIAL